MIVNLCKKGIPISDYEVEDFVDSMVYGKTYNVSSVKVITYIRTKVVEGSLDFSKITLTVEDSGEVYEKQLKVNGDAAPWKTIESQEMTWLARIFKARKKQKNEPTNKE